MNRTAVIASLCLVAGCSDDATDPQQKEPIEPSVLAAFDPTIGELPEGLAVSGDTAYVGFAPTGAIATLDLGTTGAPVPFGNLPAPPADGFMTGLALGPDSRLYAALVSPDPNVPGGIYRLPAGGGDAELFASDANMPFPNGLAFAPDAALLVTDSGKGAVLRITTDGTVSVWLEHDSLKGQLDYCGPGLNTFDIGANGIALDADSVYVANNDKASIVKIPIASDGSAGTPSLLAGPDCDRLGGADGLALDASGALWVAVNRQNRLVRVTQDGAIETRAEGAPLDFPASLALTESRLLVTSFALGAALSGGSPQPALVALDLE